MPINILMPALSPTMEKGNLAKWHVKQGDAVQPGDVVAEIETDKATMEVEAVDEGTVGSILVAEGTADVAVNTVIAVLLAEGEEAGAATSAAAPVPAPAAVVAKPAADSGPAKAAPMPAVAAVAAASGGKVFASPLARRLAKEKGLDLALIKGSGPHGRIVQRDVEGAALTGTAKPAVAATAPAPAPAPAKVPSAQKPAPRPVPPPALVPGESQLVPHDTMRKVIAERLTLSKQTIPHFYLTVDCRLDRLLALREEINGGAPVVDDRPAYKVSVNDFIIKAMALALREVPDANVNWSDEGMVKFSTSDVGVAVAIPGGLITPVVRSAEQKSITAISAEMKDFAARARARKLMPEEYQGGATAISNLGMFGIREFSAVINPPHATILAVGAGEERAIVKGGKVKTATMMTVTLSTDHRAVDGALGAELLGAFKRFIENPVTMLV